jgi:hypothetical protein
MGIGRYVGALMTHDDTMFLIAGAKPNTTVNLNSVWTSYAAGKDSIAPTARTAMTSPTGTPLTTTSVAMYFSEAVMLKAGKAITFKEGATTFAATTSLSRQVLTLTPSTALKAGTAYTMNIPNDAISDMAGNLFAGSSVTFTTDSDNSRPNFQSFITTANASTGTTISAALWNGRATSTSHIILMTTEVVTPTAASLAGTKMVMATVPPGKGKNISFNMKDAQFYTYASGKSLIYLQMPAGQNYTQNSEYTIRIPADIMVDAKGNANNVSHAVYKFKTISGSDSFMGHDKSTTLVGVKEFPKGDYASFVNVNDTLKPALVSSFPRAGATDVEPDTNVMLYFAEPVMWNYSHPGIISVMNSSLTGSTASHVVQTINATAENFKATPMITRPITVALPLCCLKRTKPLTCSCVRSMKPSKASLRGPNHKP